MICEALKYKHGFLRREQGRKQRDKTENDNKMEFQVRAFPVLVLVVFMLNFVWVSEIVVVNV
jgi:hypothetical protein